MASYIFSFLYIGLSPSRCSAFMTFSAYGATLSEIGKTIHWRGDNQKGNLPPECSSKTAHMRSIEPAHVPQHRLIRFCYRDPTKQTEARNKQASTSTKKVQKLHKRVTALHRDRTPSFPAFPSSIHTLSKQTENAGMKRQVKRRAEELKETSYKLTS